MNVFDNPVVNSKTFTCIGSKVANFINKGGWLTCIIMAINGIIMVIIAMYGKCGFDWVRFILVDIPFFSFCGWAIYTGVILPIKKHPEYFRITQHEQKRRP